MTLINLLLQKFPGAIWHRRGDYVFVEWCGRKMVWGFNYTMTSLQHISE